MHMLLKTLCFVVTGQLNAGVVETQQSPALPQQAARHATIRHNHGNVVPLAFENLNIFDSLPSYTDEFDDEMFEKWAKAQNEMAYRRAQQKADEFNARHPALDIYVQENNYTSTSTLDQNETGSSTGATVDSSSTTDYDGKNIQRTYRDQNTWGGGPVVIINPYVRGGKVNR